MLPTRLAAAGEPDIVKKVKKGYEANGKTWKVHLDGHDFLPYFRGEARKGPREEIFFGQGGELNAVRWNDRRRALSPETDKLKTGEYVWEPERAREGPLLIVASTPGFQILVAQRQALCNSRMKLHRPMPLLRWLSSLSFGC